MSILSENWCTQGLKDAYSESRLRFLKFRPQNPFYLKIITHSISRMLIPNPDLDVWNFDLKIHFWANLDPKSQRCLFCLKIGTHGILEVQIRNLDLVFEILTPKFIFGQNWAEKVKVVRFSWKLACMASWRCWFLNLGWKSQSCLFWWKLAHKHIHTQYLEDVDSYFDISFLKFQT